MLEVNKIYNGDCLDVLKTFEDNCIDSCVTDPPYFLMSGSGSGGFMNKEWDGVANFEERILWKSKEFAQYVARFFSLMRTELSMEGGGFVQGNVNMSNESNNPKKKPAPVQPAESNLSEAKAMSKQNFNSVQGLVLTEAELLGLLKEVFQDLITVSEKQNENVLYAIPLSLIEIKNKNAVPQNVVKFLMGKAQEGQTIRLSLMDEARINGAIEGMIGVRLESKSIKGMDGSANDAGNIAAGRKYSAITLNATERLKTMHWITSLLFVTFATQESKGNQNNFLVYLFHKNWLREAYRVLKPGAHILSFAGCRTYHLLASAIEDIGFEIRDQIDWNFGSGFPKSLDISKAIDKAAGVEREITNVVDPRGMYDGKIRKSEAINTNWRNAENRKDFNDLSKKDITTPATDAAKQWEGWGTALKPAHEPICMARKPLSESTVAQNVLKYGTGGLNIDGSRIGIEGGTEKGTFPKEKSSGIYGDGINGTCEIVDIGKGRFPANVIFDEFTGQILDEQSGTSKSTGGCGEKSMGALGNNVYGKYANESLAENAGGLGDEGGASRFFYTPKADNFERNKGLKGFDVTQNVEHRYGRYRCLKCGKLKLDHNPCKCENPDFIRVEANRGNNHPCVKPIDLMRYLVKLITPKHGICIDPFCGSGTTLIGCKLELIKYIGIDTNEEYCKIAEARVAAWNPERYIEQTLF